MWVKSGITSRIDEMPQVKVKGVEAILKACKDKFAAELMHCKVRTLLLACLIM